MHIHKRLQDGQIATVLQQYCQKQCTIDDVLNLLGLRRSRFFDLLRRYRQNPKSFSISYQRETPKRLTKPTEQAIHHALLEEKALIDNPVLPITTYNYSAIRDRLEGKGMHVATSTIIERAKIYDCYKPTQRKKNPHDRLVITTAIGALIQHDSSRHLFSPYAKEKWSLITSLDDYSRLIPFGDFVASETTWEHIQATKTLVLTYGIPHRYYVDQLRTFRFVAREESIWVEQRVGTDEVNPQWKQVVVALGSDVIYALSPQAKGKIERPYRWLQDRIVRTCALEKISDIADGREVLRYELDRYNNRQVHSTTKEIPIIRFRKAKEEGKTLFRPFMIPKPYTHINDIFCLREKRRTNGYRRISFFRQELQLTKVPPYEEVSLHLVPYKQTQTLEVRIWWHDIFILTITYPLKLFPAVHF